MLLVLVVSMRLNWVNLLFQVQRRSLSSPTSNSRSVHLHHKCITHNPHHHPQLCMSVLLRPRISTVLPRASRSIPIYHHKYQPAPVRAHVPALQTVIGDAVSPLYPLLLPHLHPLRVRRHAHKSAIQSVTKRVAIPGRRHFRCFPKEQKKLLWPVRARN